MDKMSCNQPAPKGSEDNLGDRGEPLAAADVAGELGEAEVDQLPRWRREGVRGRGRSWNREFPSDQNRNREFFIQLIEGRYLIHFDTFYLTNVLKSLLCDIIINLKLM